MHSRQNRFSDHQDLPETGLRKTGVFYMKLQYLCQAVAMAILLYCYYYIGYIALPWLCMLHKKLPSTFFFLTPAQVCRIGLMFKTPAGAFAAQTSVGRAAATPPDPENWVGRAVFPCSFNWPVHFLWFSKYFHLGLLRIHLPSSNMISSY